MGIDKASEMMATLLALEPHLNALAANVADIEGDDGRWFRKEVGEIMGAASVLIIEIGHRYPDLNPDRAH